MANTFIPIAKAALTSTSTYVDFTGIPATFNNLYLVGSARGNSGVSQSIYISVNYATTGYGSTTFQAWETDGSATSYNSYANMGAIPGASAGANIFNSFECFIPNYGSSVNKIFNSYTVSSNNATTLNTAIRQTRGYLTDTNAINSIRIVVSSTDFVSGTRFDLYGIKNT